ncbi:SRPBCC family protein [Sphingobium sp. AN558]|uniref:SRPBCC family protein n=1 Tax=Sphingobium sp. AN558 TaxID=3133442 RepID=UPI0030C09FEE
MADTPVPPHPDDAPAATSKQGNPTAAVAGSLPDAKRDALVAKTVTINRPRDELYAYWRDFANLPHFMENLVSIKVLDARRSHWVVKAPAGQTVEWTATVTDDVPGALIAWTSEDGADVPNSGRVEFRDAPGGRGTWVSATILYNPPGGIIGKVVAKMFQREPAIQARRELRRFKQLMETGEIATGAWTRKQLQEEQA